ncbi:ribosome recycling factor [Mariprofundus ferrinatatus]|uniref:Ribosome-recycling factor n=1 Tax=Mariprofundus ferrinatatus TaxID=1921087 RepID=A0A2K8L525_9PROT|nr:ribosome recycling factor [Mariprofundus ferrinatatus]ATX82343.1 ribosome recycling factor [Mariprofundus ferrinatatus]
MFKDVENRMQKSIAALKSDLATIRTGRANAALLDHVRVSYYGSEVPINQVGNLSVPEPRMLMITPWEKNLIADIEKAILKSDLGLNPTSDGEVVRLVLPELTEDRRRDLVKQVKAAGEKSKVSIRNIRRDANDEVKHQVKDEGLPEDESKRLQDQIQKITDRFIAEVDEIIEHKETEILTV